MLLLFKNDDYTPISGNVAPTDTSINLQAGAGVLFPVPVSGTSYFTATLVDAATGLVKEIVWCTAVNGDTVTVVRAQEGTAALSWKAGDTFANLITAGAFAAFGQTTTVIGAIPTKDWYVDYQFGQDDTAHGQGTGANAFKTIQFAINTLANTYYSPYVNIHVANNVNYAGFNVSPSAIGFWDIIGNEVTPSSVVVTSASTSVNQGYGCTLSDGVFARIRGFKFLSYDRNAFVQAAYLILNNNAYTPPSVGATSSAITASHGQIQLGGTNTYTGPGATGSLFSVDGAGKMVMGYQLVTQPWTYCTFNISGSPSFTGACAVCSNEGFFGVNPGNTISGNATGQRYIVNSNSLINVNGQGTNFFAGNSGGTTANGGLYLS